MVQLNSAMDVFKLLDKSNCRKCKKPTCLAFAAAVFKGEMQLGECPHLEREIIERCTGKIAEDVSLERAADQLLEELKGKVATMDLPTTAPRVGGTFCDGQLTLKILGKDFSIDTNGNIRTDLHLNSWLTIPVLSYVVAGEGVPPSGEWVPFRELEGGKTSYLLFERKCEKAIKKVADTYTDLFGNMVRIFSGRPVANHYSSDISLILDLLPRLPMLICYWRPEDGLESDLNIFFDSTAEKNLDSRFIHRLGVGLALMFEKLALRHGKSNQQP